MAGITTYLSILTLNVNGLNPPSKDIVWQNGLKRESQQSIVYRRPILLTETHTGLGVKALWDTAKVVLRGKFIFMSAYIKMIERSQKTT
jgi:hypothetical protein